MNDYRYMGMRDPREQDDDLFYYEVENNRNSAYGYAMENRNQERIVLPDYPVENEKPASPGAGPLGLPTPSLPSEPDGEIQIPLPPMIGNPELPEVPEQGMGRANVRVLNGAANYGELAVMVGEDTVADSLPFGTSTQYKKVPDGFRIVTVLAARYPKRVLYRQIVPFVAGMSFTIALVNTVNGIGIQVITDIPCRTMTRKMACLRMVNLSYNSGALDLLLDDGRVVFSDVHFKEVTQYKRANVGRYDFKVINSPNRPMPIVMDIAIINDLTYRMNGKWNSLLEFSIDMKENTMYTLYIIGNDGYLPSLQPYILEN